MVPGISVGWFSCASTYYSEFVEFDTTWVGEDDDRTWSKVYDTLTGSLTDISTNGFLQGTIAAASSAASNGAGSGTGHTNPTSGSSSKSSTPIGAIVGGVVGGLVVIGAIVGVVLFFLLRSRRNQGNNGQAAATTGGVTAFGKPPPAEGQGAVPNMTQQQPQTQSVYGAPVGYQPQQDGLAAGYYSGGKQDFSPNVQQGGFDTVAGKMHGSPQVTQHEVKPPLSPAPPYSQPFVASGGISPVGTPPPNVQELNAHAGSNQMQSQYAPQQQFTQQPMGGVASFGGPPPHTQHQATELPTQYATTLHTSEGQPIYEAPDQLYRGVQ